MTTYCADNGRHRAHWVNGAASIEQTKSTRGF
jgi:hypothetical protein